MEKQLVHKVIKPQQWDQTKLPQFARVHGRARTEISGASR
jgi:hypothetical protein